MTKEPKNVANYVHVGRRRHIHLQLIYECILLDFFIFPSAFLASICAVFKKFWPMLQCPNCLKESWKGCVLLSNPIMTTPNENCISKLLFQEEDSYEPQLSSRCKHSTRNRTTESTFREPSISTSNLQFSVRSWTSDVFSWPRMSWYAVLLWSSEVTAAGQLFCLTSRWISTLWSAAIAQIHIAKPFQRSSALEKVVAQLAVQPHKKATRLQLGAWLWGLARLGRSWNECHLCLPLANALERGGQRRESSGFLKPLQRMWSSVLKQNTTAVNN